MTISIVKGVEGFAIYFNNYRIIGNKPWAGGRIIQEWKIARSVFQTRLMRCL